MKPVWTTDQIVGQLANWELRWNVEAPIAYFFYVRPIGYLGSAPNFSAFSLAQRASLMRTMELVSDITPLTFQSVPDNSQLFGPTNKRLGFYNVNASTEPYWGVTKDFTTQNENAPYGEFYGADIAVNLYRANTQGGWGIGDSNSRKLMHELLHGLGLDHPGPYNGDSADYESQALFQQDSAQYTVMSYWAASVTGADHELNGVFTYASTPQLYDVAALQYLYGANMTTRTGDTVYGFHSTAGREVFDLSLHPQAVFTIWDAGGRDTFDLSGYATPSAIDLHDGGFSDAGGLTDNISIAFHARIEDAIGGLGADVLIANPSTNGLTGGGGGDIFTFATLADAQGYSLRSDGRKTLPDTLVDFQSGVDRIDLSGIDARPQTVDDDAFTFIGAAAFHHVAGELRWEVSNGRLFILGDVDGDGLADLHITAPGPAIQAADFIL
jgi:serralysin